VLDNLSSGIASLNHGSWFLYDGVNHGNKVDILSFEVGKYDSKSFFFVEIML
jgi:hypothetical protein